MIISYHIMIYYDNLDTVNNFYHISMIFGRLPQSATRNTDTVCGGLIIHLFLFSFETSRNGMN